ncbi:MAG: hypothetical protein JXO49_05535, partial [Deltaproteobacteria bacterium]|nr:hypothetical protein [Deltaproteobacteria bacterium]
PGYSRKTKSSAGEISDPPLQDHLSGKDKQIQDLKGLLPASALQDLLTLQPTVFIGLIALFTGSRLQDEIAAGLVKVVNLGQDILNAYNLNQGERHDAKTTHLSGKSPPGTGTIQLDRSPPGA